MRNEAYGENLARVYDALNNDVDYEAYADFYETVFRKYGNSVKHVCEMACGTGSMAAAFAKRGYRVTAFDLSDDMLAAAEKKTRDAGLENVRFTKQDMRSFRVYTPADACICMMDSLNCLPSNDELADTFAGVHTALADGGLFIFDVNGKHKFETTYGDNAYVLEDEHVLLAWQNFYHPSTRSCDLYLTFFTEEPDGRYSRADEHMRQHYFPAKTVRKLLDEEGFDLLDTVEDLAFTPADESRAERLFFLCRKK